MSSKSLPLLLILAACGDPDDPDTTVDPTDPTQPTGTPTEPLPVEPTVDVVPGPGWIDVAPRANVVAQFSVDIDPTSVDAAELQIIDDFGRDYDAVVSVEGATVTLDPTRAFPHDLDIALSLTGLRLLDGRDAPDVVIDFRTHPSVPLEVYAFYFEGSIFIYQSHDFDDDHRLIRTEHVMDPGPDQEFGTSDDPLQAVTLREYDDQGRESSLWTYFSGSEGPDGLIATADDVGYDYSLTTYEGNEQRSTDRNVGPDNLPETEDDRVYNVSRRRTDHGVMSSHRCSP